jgi:hypothetical protein
MLSWIYSIHRVHHRSSHEYLRVMIVQGEGKGETVVTTPDRLDRFSCLKRLHVQGPMGECLFLSCRLNRSL